MRRAHLEGVLLLFGRHTRLSRARAGDTSPPRALRAGHWALEWAQLLYGRTAQKQSGARRPPRRSYATTDEPLLGGNRVVVAWIAQHVAAPPDRLDVMLATGRRLQLLAQLADEDVDDLELGLVHAAVEMI
jgi:hypothetical protein